jgi:hypothetical protein
MQSNAVSNKGEPRKILGGKNLTVARATFATVWIRAWTGPKLIMLMSTNGAK